MYSKLFQYYFLIYMFLTSMFFYGVAVVIWMITRPFDVKLRLLHMYTSFWGYLYILTNPFWKVKFKGKEKIDKKEAYIVVSNHQSQADILVAFGLFFHYKWVSKAEIFKVPFIGWNMSLNRYIALKRGDKQSIKEMMDIAEQRVREGSSVYFFPEGSRSLTGELKDFKKGAFELALKMKRPILPISLIGTREALPKYSMEPVNQNMFLNVMDPIPYEEFATKSVEELASFVREKIKKEHESMKSLLNK